MVYDLTNWIANYPTQLAFIPALIGAGAAIVGSLISSRGARKANNQNIDFQREMWEKQVAQQDKVNKQQMAYQDKINAENRAWADESAVRERVEKAGYNPYLYNNQAAASSVGAANSANLSNSVAPLGMSYQNELSSFDDVGSSVGGAIAQGVQAAKEAYALKRQKAVDQRNDQAAGVVGGTESAITQSQLQASASEARVKAAQAQMQEMEYTLLNLQARDENNMPMVDETTGRPVTLAEQRQRGQNMELFKRIDKLKSAILADQVNWENVSVDTLLKRYHLEYLEPAQYDIVRQTLSNLIAENAKIKKETEVLGTQVGLNQSQIQLNNSNSALNSVLSKLNMQKTLTEQQQTKLAAWNSYIQSDKDMVEMVKNIASGSDDQARSFIESLLDPETHFAEVSSWSRFKRVKSRLMQKYGRRKGMAR